MNKIIKQSSYILFASVLLSGGFVPFQPVKADDEAPSVSVSASASSQVSENKPSSASSIVSSQPEKTAESSSKVTDEPKSAVQNSESATSATKDNPMAEGSIELKGPITEYPASGAMKQAERLLLYKSYKGVKVIEPESAVDSNLYLVYQGAVYKAAKADGDNPDVITKSDQRYISVGKFDQKTYRVLIGTGKDTGKLLTGDYNDPKIDINSDFARFLMADYTSGRVPAPFTVTDKLQTVNKYDDELSNGYNPASQNGTVDMAEIYKNVPLIGRLWLDNKAKDAIETEDGRFYVDNIVSQVDGNKAALNMDFHLATHNYDILNKSYTVALPEDVKANPISQEINGKSHEFSQKGLIPSFSGEKQWLILKGNWSIKDNKLSVTYTSASTKVANVSDASQASWITATPYADHSSLPITGGSQNDNGFISGKILLQATKDEVTPVPEKPSAKPETKQPTAKKADVRDIKTGSSFVSASLSLASLSVLAGLAWIKMRFLK